METFLSLFADFQVWMKANPIVAGVVSLWGLTVLTWTLRTVPLRIYGFFKGQLTTTLMFNNQSTGTNLETFSNFMEWFEKSWWARFSRSLSLNGGGWHNEQDGGTVVGMGNGNHFFFYRGRPFWLTRTQLQSQGAWQIFYEINVTTLGRNRQIILDLIEEFRYRPQPDKIGIYQLENKDWLRITDVAKRDLSTVIVNAEVKKQLLKNIEEFRASRDWYSRRGLPYKLTYLLHGIPGTGKSSLIKALAGHFNLNLCVLHLTYMSDSMLERAMATAPKNSLIVIEDCDSASAAKARRAMLSQRQTVDPIPVLANGAAVPTTSSSVLEQAPPAPVEAVTETTDDDKTSFLTLSGLLNALDGVVALDNTIIMLTTNVIATLDPALIRAGRVDHILEIGKLEDAEIREYIALMFGDVPYGVPSGFRPILGCDLQKLYFEHRHNVHEFVAAIPTSWTVRHHGLQDAMDSKVA